MQLKTSPKRNLTTASREWITRRADERFWTLGDAAAASFRVHDLRRTFETKPTNLTATAEGGTVWLSLDGSKSDAIGFGFSHWGFSQIASKVGAPAEYLRKLPAPMVANLLNHHFQGAGEIWKKDARISIRSDTFLPQVECITSGSYGYIPNYRVFEALEKLEDAGWAVPPARKAPIEGLPTRPATKEDLASWRKLSVGAWIQEGDAIAPAGIYSGDRDMFALMVRGPKEKGSVLEVGKVAMNAFVMVRNSEVGYGSFGVTLGFYDFVCGNHIIWGASDITEFSTRHLGNSAELRALETIDVEDAQVVGLRDSMAAQIKLAQKTVLGADRKETIERVWNVGRKVKLAMKELELSYDLCDKLDGDRANPRTVWGMVTGVTRLSQKMPNADDRARLDGQVAGLMAMAN